MGNRPWFRTVACRHHDDLRSFWTVSQRINVDYEPISTDQAVREISVWFAYGVVGVLCLLGLVHAAASWGMV